MAENVITRVSSIVEDGEHEILGAQDAPNEKRARMMATSAASSSTAADAAQTDAQPRRSWITRAHSFKRDAARFQLLIGVTGSVATIKLEEILSEVYRACGDKVVMRIVTTECARHFFDADSLSIPVYGDAEEWALWRTRGDPILHIELRRWADAMLIAPLGANTLAKLANGQCDNLLTSVVRAWDPAKALYFCPAMNTYMWENPLTFKHLDVLKNLLNFKEIPAVEKELMCGDKGYGAMAPVQMIVSVIASEVKKREAFYSVH